MTLTKKPPHPVLLVEHLCVPSPARGEGAAMRAAPCCAFLPTQAASRHAVLDLELAGLAEAPEVGRRDRFDGGRLDAESLEGAALAHGFRAHDIVALEQLDLIGR